MVSQDSHLPHLREVVNSRKRGGPTERTLFGFSSSLKVGLRFPWRFSWLVLVSKLEINIVYLLTLMGILK